MSHVSIPSPAYIDFSSPTLQISTQELYFIDTSFLIAVADPADIFHSKAIVLWQKLTDCVLVTHSIAIVEFIHVYTRTLYIQDRKTDIFYQVKGDKTKFDQIIKGINFKNEWDCLNRTNPVKTYTYFCKVLPFIEQLLKNNVLTLQPDNLEIILDSFKLKAKYNLGSSDATLLAVAKSIGAIFVTTDLRLARNYIEGITIYATTP